MSSPDVSIQYDRQSHAKAHGNASQQFHPLNAGATEALGSLADSGASPHSVDTNDDNESAAGHSDATSVASDLENLSPNTSFSADNEAEPHKDQSRASERDIPDDPFESERTRILFDAVDKIRSLCQKELNIPQLITVGDQSSGKSSLLRTLTDVPFPTGAGRCTRFPIRVVSQRTAPGTKSKYHITIEPPELSVAELPVADEEAEHYKGVYGEGPLTLDTFTDALEEISKDKIGIRKGKGAGKKNFVANVVKIVLSGPNRSQFSILDLPGLFTNDSDVNKDEMRGVKKMAIEYMKKPENIVICVAAANNDMHNQIAGKLALDYADKHRIIAVLTKCDAIAASQIKAMAAEAVGDSEEGADTMPGGWFVVRSRHDDDPPQLDLDAEEAQLFGRSGWSKVPDHKKGTSALKLHLSNLLSNRIAEAFPSLVSDIESKLDSAHEQKKSLGEPRETLAAKQKYLLQFVEKYGKQVAHALDRPNPDSLPEVKLRGHVARLNKEFDDAMRTYGQKWQFEYPEIQSWHELKIIIDFFRSLDNGEHTATVKAFVDQMERRAKLGDKSPYKRYDNVLSHDDFLEKIKSQMNELQASQLSGVINPDILPIMYRMQVEKWEKIARTHLEQVLKTVQTCYEAILQHLCPRDDMRILYAELQKLLRPIFDKTVQEAMAELDAYCERVLRPHMLQTLNPEWARQLDGWKRFRSYDITSKYECTLQSLSEVTREDWYSGFYDRHARGSPENMATEVHDHIHVFYNLTLETFVNHVNVCIIENLVSRDDGPLRGLTSTFLTELSEQEVDRMAGESKQTVLGRMRLNSKISELTEALSITREAEEEMRALEA